MNLKGKEINLFIVLEGIFWSFIISIIIRVLSLRTIFKILTPEKPVARYNSNIIVNSISALLALENRVIPVKCWKKSMLLYHFLRKYGYEARMHFAVKINSETKNKSLLYGHSWVSLNNNPISENDYKFSESMTEIMTYP